jgi:hypothetical protein
MSPGEFSPLELAFLPAPVRRYFLFALKPGQPMIQHARVVQTGRFRAGGFDSKWNPFAAVQHFAAGPPGFVWDARIHMAPLLTARIRDSYIRGRGAMRGRIASILPIVDRSDTHELAEGALQRYLAEAVWLPTALLPGQGVVWEPIDGSTARATLSDHGVTVSLDFEFGDTGEIVRCYTDARYRDVNGDFVATPWACCYGDYAQVDGMMIPHSGETEWILPEGWYSYCRLHLRTIEFFGNGSLKSPENVRPLLGIQDISDCNPHVSRRFAVGRVNDRESVQGGTLSRLK